VTEKLSVAALGVLLCLLQVPAQAVNLKWLEHAPVRFFSDADWALATAAVDDALANPEDGTPVQWNNPDSGHRGSATALGTLKRDGRTCRQLALENEARGMSGRSVFLYCLQPDGEWKIEPQDAGASPPGSAAGG
jgi:hypothetical protein